MSLVIHIGVHKPNVIPLCIHLDRVLPDFPTDLESADLFLLTSERARRYLLRAALDAYSVVKGVLESRLGDAAGALGRGDNVHEGCEFAGVCCNFIK